MKPINIFWIIFGVVIVLTIIILIIYHVKCTYKNNYCKPINSISIGNNGSYLSPKNNKCKSAENCTTCSANQIATLTSCNGTCACINNTSGMMSSTSTGSITN